MKSLKLITIITALVLFVACKNTTPKSETNDTSILETKSEGKGQSAVQDNESDPNALQVAKSLDDFKTLVVAIEAAGVEDALVNAGPLTIFAPVNAAFDKLPDGTVESLLKPENKAKLAFILVNHVAVVDAIDGLEMLNACALGLADCNNDAPCPFHATFAELKKKFIDELTFKTIKNLSDEIVSGQTKISHW